MRLSFLLPLLLAAGAAVGGRVLPRTGQGAAPADGEARDRAAVGLLERRCISCHGPEKQKSGLRLDGREAALAGGESGRPAVAPGAGERSELIRRVRLTDDDAMPPKGEPLTQEEIALLGSWIDAGASWPSGAKAAAFPIEGAREEDVREILAERCQRCHGESRARSGLRLDRRESALAGGRSGLPAIVPGASAESELIRRVRRTDDDAMPAEGEPLTEEQVRTLERWIDGGAPWPSGMGVRHWAYVAPVRPPLPVVEHEQWVRTQIDRFVLARLEAEGIEPSPEADRATLLRRLSLDLVGMPPTPEELEEFLADDSEDAYERQVDRLLASPHFGERWGRHWLDLARYSDSNGYSRDFERSIWPYRDWVVNALNEDMPFDRFTIEQIAGDLLPEPTRDQLVATGFHRNTLVQDEGGADDEEFRVEAVKNRVETTATVWLGSTMLCAQCHDHKYDPFEQRDYYRMFAFFNQTEDRGRSTSPRMELPTPEQQAEMDRIDPELERLDRVLHTMTPELRRARERWIDGYVGENVWTVLEPSRLSSSGEVELVARGDGSFLATGEDPDEAVYTVVATSPLERITAVRLEALTDPSLPNFGPGRGEGGNFALTELSVAPATEEGEEPADPLAFLRATASFGHPRGPVEFAIDGDRATGWAVYSRTGYTHQAVVELEEPLVLAPGAALEIDLGQEYGEGLTLGCFRLSVTGELDPPRAAVLPRELLEKLLATPAEERTSEQETLLDRYFLSVATELDPVREERDRLRAQRPVPVTTLVMRAVDPPRKSWILRRGNFLDPGQVVQPGVPEFLLPLPETEGRPTRLDLARWLVDRDNPLTARVQVNRWWQRLFGLGLVETENDFGTRGNPPSHPQLLDWLAVELMEGGWSLKDTLRRMVTSSTYRQSSRPRPDLRERDPRNRLLARQSRIRLEGEAIRDSALLASGRLNPAMGGPPVFPPAPGFDSVRAADKAWPESHGPDRYRRTLYTWNWRNSPYPFVETFDGPGGNDACTRRHNSNTPLQALVMANDPMVFELAQGLAARVLRTGAENDRERLSRAFRWCLSRLPGEEELAVLQSFLDDQRTSFAASPAAARDAAPGELPPDATATEAAAWTALARVLFNLDEFLTRG